MVIGVVAAVCVLLLILAFLVPRLSRGPQKGVDRTLGVGQQAGGKAPGPIGKLLSKPFSSSRKATNKSAPRAARPAARPRCSRPVGSQPVETRLLIGGEQVAGEGPPLAVENPATEETVAAVGAPSAEQLDAALAAAREAAAGWGATPAVERGEMLHEVAARLRARTDELARVMTLEGGKPLIENTDEVGWTAAAFDLLRRDGPQLRRPGDPADRVHPAGAGAQGADRRGRRDRALELPAAAARWKLAPALAAGNTVVAKPSRADAALDADAGRLLRRPPPRRGRAARRRGRRGLADRRRRARRLRRLHRLGRHRQADRRPPAPSGWRGSTSRWAARTRSSSAPTWPPTWRSPPAAAPGRRT